MKKVPELLAPAGNMESLQTAVRAGADAVYFGMGRLNARASAKNFDRSSVRDAIDECHAWGARAHLTLNTLLLDREMQEALDTAAWLYECGADALIVQDMGLISLLRSKMPAMPLHGSTQMSLTNGDGIRMLEKLGFQRGVLGRECSWADIRTIAVESSLELEVFVHGAMCVSVSGQCLHSSLLGGRSGNRGACAQPCRMAHRCGGENGYLLSMRDQCQLENLPELAEIGVASLKIEGRMKSPEYVNAVVRAYREALDMLGRGAEEDEYATYCQEAKAELAASFSRNGSFSTGYLLGREGLIDERDPSYGAPVKTEGEAPVRKLPLQMVFMALAGRKSALTLQQGDVRVMVYGDEPQAAEKVALDGERAHSALCRLGDTPYECVHMDIMLDPGLFLPVAALNALRREGVAVLARKIAQRHRRPATSTRLQFTEPAKKRKAVMPRIVAGVQKQEQMLAAIEAGVEALLLQPRDWRRPALEEHWNWLEAQRQRRGKLPLLWLELPAVTLPRAAAQVRAYVEEEKLRFDGLVVNNLGHLDWARNCELPVYGGCALNVSNTVSAVTYSQGGGLDSVMLSPELNAAQMGDIMGRAPHCGLLVYGKVAAMQLRHCPMRRKKQHCGDCNEGLTYTDRKEEHFSLLPTRYGKDGGDGEDCLWQLYNSRPQDLARQGEKLRALPALEWRLHFVDEDGEMVRERINAYRSLRYGGGAEPLENSTSGHFKRGWV